MHDPEKAPIPPYNLVTPEMKYDWALMSDNIQTMDVQVGNILKELEDDGLSENTIVFYYSKSKQLNFPAKLLIAKMDLTI